MSDFSDWVAKRWATQSKKARRNKRQALDRDRVVAGLGVGGEDVY